MDETVSVVGAGRMGAGIGLDFARRGAAVTYLVRDVDRARERVHGLRDELARLGPAVWPREPTRPLSFVTAVADLPASDLVVESVPEDLAVKQQLLARLSAAQPAALLCSNTSSLTISQLAAGTSRPDRVAGMHFWYPPPLMPLVELVPGELTSAETLAAAERILRSAGKTPVRLRHDQPGFVWNRLQVAILREAKAIVESGVVGAREVDLVVEQGLARRWALTGPLAAAVLGGLPTFEAVGRNLLPTLSGDHDLDGLARLLDGYLPDPDAVDRWRTSRLAALDEGRPDPDAAEPDRG